MNRPNPRSGPGSALPPHDAALDEHHDCLILATLAVGAQAISSGCRKGLTLIEGLPVSRFHVVHHVAHASLWTLASGLLGESGAGDADRDDGRNGDNQSAHDVSPFAGNRGFPESLNHRFNVGIVTVFAMLFRFCTRNS